MTQSGFTALSLAAGTQRLPPAVRVMNSYWNLLLLLQVYLLISKQLTALILRGVKHSIVLTGVNGHCVLAMEHKLV